MHPETDRDQLFDPYEIQNGFENEEDDVDNIQFSNIRHDTSSDLDDTSLNDLNVITEPVSLVESWLNSYSWEIIRASLNTLVHSLIAASVFVTLWFSFKSSPISVFEWHIGLSMIGYQLLMSHAILSLYKYNGWSAPLTFAHRRRVHWILQLVGSVIAIVGSAIMIQSKTVNFNSLHGKFALAALIFTCASLINGLSSMYTAELRRYVPPKLSKMTHSLFGIVAFGCSSLSLIYGYKKNSFIKWSSSEFANVMIAITSIYTLIVIAAPCFALIKNLYKVCKIKIF